MPIKTEDEPQIEPRVAEAIKLLGSLRPAQVADAIAKRYRIHIRTAWTTVREARKKIAETTIANGTVAEVKKKLLQQWEDELEAARADGDRASAARALEAIARLTGANEPEKVEHSGTSGVLVVGGDASNIDEWAKKFGKQSTDGEQPEEKKK